VKRGKEREHVCAVDLHSLCFLAEKAKSMREEGKKEGGRRDWKAFLPFFLVEARRTSGREGRQERIMK